MMLDALGHRYLKWRRKMFEAWIGLKILATIAGFVLFAIFLLYAAVTSR